MATSQSIKSPKLDKSALFATFNRARAISAGLDRARVNRALGIVQAGRVKLLGDGSAAVTNEDGTVYMVKGKSCTCPDHTFRNVACKHVVASWLAIRLMQAATPAPAPTIIEQALEDEIALLYGVA